MDHKVPENEREYDQKVLELDTTMEREIFDEQREKLKKLILETFGKMRALEGFDQMISIDLERQSESDFEWDVTIMMRKIMNRRTKHFFTSTGERVENVFES